MKPANIKWVTSFKERRIGGLTSWIQDSYKDYPLSIAGVPSTEKEASRVCDRRDKFGKTCSCDATSQDSASPSHAASPGSEVGLMIQTLWPLRNANNTQLER